MGALIFTDHISPAMAYTWDIPQLVQDLLVHRTQQIIPAELLAVPVTACALGDICRNRDTICFIDNTAALAALVKSTSSQQDAAHITMVTIMVFLDHRARVWYEYVNTKQNPADVLSREAWEDPQFAIGLRVDYGKQLIPHRHGNCSQVAFPRSPIILRRWD